MKKLQRWHPSRPTRSLWLTRRSFMLQYLTFQSCLSLMLPQWLISYFLAISFSIVWLCCSVVSSEFAFFCPMCFILFACFFFLTDLIFYTVFRFDLIFLCVIWSLCCLIYLFEILPLFFYWIFIILLFLCRVNFFCCFFSHYFF